MHSSPVVPGSSSILSARGRESFQLHGCRAAASVIYAGGANLTPDYPHCAWFLRRCPTVRVKEAMVLPHTIRGHAVCSTGVCFGHVKLVDFPGRNRAPYPPKPIARKAERPRKISLKFFEGRDWPCDRPTGRENLMNKSKSDVGQ